MSEHFFDLPDSLGNKFRTKKKSEEAMTILKFIIPGLPRPKQSVRTGVIYNRAGKPVTYTDKNSGKTRVLQRQFQPKETVENERSIKLIIKEQLPKDFQILQDEVVITKLHYIFPPLKSFPKKKLDDIAAGKIIYKTTKPDLTDNLNKGLFDAMQGIVFLNDSQICELNDVKKYYGFNPRTEIEISLLNNNGQEPNI